MRCALLHLLFVLLVVGAGCDVFAPRTPAPPESDGGTFVQPDAPDLVVDNLRAAVAELNTANYRRSLADALVFEPTAEALARNPALWAGWGKAEEVSAFTTLAEAARRAPPGVHTLRLDDVSSELGDRRFTFDASYVLVMRHQRPGVPDTVQGRLVWEITQGADGLWSLARWNDRTLGNSPSWSDLKAEFGR